MTLGCRERIAQPVHLHSHLRGAPIIEAGRPPMALDARSGLCRQVGQLALLGHIGAPLPPIGLASLVERLAPETVLTRDRIYKRRLD